jgi:transposase
MRPPIRVRALTDDERRAVEAGLRSSDALVLRRCQMVAASARGEVAPAIARSLGCSDQTVRQVLHAFNAEGVAALARRSSRPHTVRVAVDAEGGERLRQLLHQSPRAFGKPASVWTLPLLAAVCAEQGITATRVSGETIRQTLTRLGLRWQQAKRWVCSPDPAYAQKNGGGIAW